MNRRNSDLIDKADGVLYTSDGRDVEMAVPSTKAFYAQIAAGYLLAVAHRRRARRARPATASHELLVALRELPDAMRQVLAQRESIAGDRAAARAAASATGRWSATGSTASPPPRCG